MEQINRFRYSIKTNWSCFIYFKNVNQFQILFLLISDNRRYAVKKLIDLQINTFLSFVI